MEIDGAFRLVVRKNGERKRYAKKLTPAMIVSIPKAQLPVRDLHSLTSQLCNELPNAWSLKKEDGKIILYSLDTSSSNPILRYSITIQERFTWYLSAFGYNVSPQLCRVLSSTPDILDTVSKVNKLTVISV